MCLFFSIRSSFLHFFLNCLLELCRFKKHSVCIKRPSCNLFSSVLTCFCFCNVGLFNWACPGFYSFFFFGCCKDVVYQWLPRPVFVVTLLAPRVTVKECSRPTCSDWIVSRTFLFFLFVPFSHILRWCHLCSSCRFRTALSVALSRRTFNSVLRYSTWENEVWLESQNFKLATDHAEIEVAFWKGALKFGCQASLNVTY